MKTRIAAITLAMIGVTSFASCHAEESETSGTNGTAGNGSSPGVVQKVEHGVERAAEATGRGVKRAGEATAHGVKWAADGVERGAKAAGRGLKHGAEATGRAVDKAAKKVTGTSASTPARENSNESSGSAPAQ